MGDVTCQSDLIAAIRSPEEMIFLRETGEPSINVYRAQAPGRAVLYVHGASFPAQLSMMYRMDGYSWADDLHARGFDVWAFDFAGYGGSDRPASMQLLEVGREEVPGRARDAAQQIERVASYIREHVGCPQISIIAHSWGTIAAGLFATMRPDWIDRLVLFGPVAQREGRQGDLGPTAPFRLFNARDQWASFEFGVPNGLGPPIARDRFDQWMNDYLATDSSSGKRTPPSVKVPAGPDVDFEDAWNGQLPYDPAAIRAQTLIVRGEWDAITEDQDATWLVNAMSNVPGGACDVKLERGGHRMHLEQNRQELFDTIAEFLAKGCQ